MWRLKFPITYHYIFKTKGHIQLKKKTESKLNPSYKIGHTPPMTKKASGLHMFLIFLHLYHLLNSNLSKPKIPRKRSLKIPLKPTINCVKTKLNTTEKPPQK